MRPRRFNRAARRLDDRHELAAVRLAPPTSAPSTSRTAEQFGGVVGLDRAAIEDADAPAALAVSGRPSAARSAACISATSAGGRDLAGADRPDRLIGDDQLAAPPIRREASRRAVGRRPGYASPASRCASLSPTQTIVTKPGGQRGLGLGADQRRRFRPDRRGARYGRRSRSSRRPPSASRPRRSRYGRRSPPGGNPARRSSGRRSGSPPPRSG